MRTVACGLLLIVAGAAVPAPGRAEPRVGTTNLGAIPATPPDPAPRYDSRLRLHLGHASAIRTVAGGIDASPFVTALPGNVWHGRLRSFGVADGVGFSGIAVRARSIDFRASQSEHHVSGFLASELRYGIKMDRDDLLTVDLNAASQRLPAALTIGRGKSVRVTSFYMGAALMHDQRLSLTGGWYRLRVSTLSALDYGVERAVGMPAAGQGMRLGLDWRLGSVDRPNRISLDFRDGDADRDRILGLRPTMGRERRMLLRFTEPF